MRLHISELRNIYENYVITCNTVTNGSTDLLDVRVDIIKKTESNISGCVLQNQLNNMKYITLSIPLCLYLRSSCKTTNGTTTVTIYLLNDRSIFFSLRTH